MDEPAVFAVELLAAVELIETSEGVGAPFPTAKHPALRRLLLRKSRCHLYFEVNRAAQTIEIRHIWDGRRARAPQL